MGKYKPPMMRDRQQSPAVEALNRELHPATFALRMCWMLSPCLCSLIGVLHQLAATKSISHAAKACRC